MASTNTTQFDGAFKRVYGEGSDVLIEQQNLNAPFFSTIKVASEKPSSQGIYNPVIMEGNENGGAINELEAFQEPTSVLPVQPSITSKTVVWPFQLSGKVMELSKTDKQAFATALDSQQQDNTKRITSDLNRQSQGVGTGQITLANGSGSAATALIVDDPFPFRIGMYIESYASLGGAKEVGVTTAAKITAINLSTSTLTLSAAQTWSDNSIICKKGVLDGVTSATNAKEMMGIRGIIDTTTFSTTFEGVSVSTYGQWQGNVIDASTAPVSQDLLQRTFNRVSIVSGEKPNLLQSNYGQARTFLNTELEKTRYEPGTIKGGNVVLKWGTMTWIVDHTSPINEVDFINTNHVKRFQTRDVHLADYDGKALSKVYGRDAVGGYYRFEGNIGTWARFKHGRLIGLTEPTF